MAVSYSVASGGFVQSGPINYTFSLSGDLEIPAGLLLPFQHVKSAFNISSATAIFRTAGTATYSLTVTSTDNVGANSQTHINAVTLTPTNGGRLLATVALAGITADRILRVTLTSNSGTPASDFTLSLE